MSRYALHLADTIRIQEKGSVLLSEGIKSVKDQMFYENEGEDEEKPAKKLPTIPRANGSPNKKTVGGKVLRNANRSTQDEAHQTAAAKMIEHQKDLHSQLNERGVERYSEAGDPSATKEGKTWRKFNSYRGEAALPPEAEKQRVRFSVVSANALAYSCYVRYSSTGRHRLLCSLFMALPFPSTSILSRMPARTTKETTRISASTSKLRVS